MGSRRHFIKRSLQTGTGMLALSQMSLPWEWAVPVLGDKMRFGLVTYLWGQDWDIPTLIANGEATGVLGVELRIEHAHGVESSLNAQQRREVKAQFADSTIVPVGLGTNFAYHYTDPERLKREIQGAKEYIRLSHDIGATGVKVKPDRLPQGVPVAQTVQQIGQSLNEVGQFAAEYGQEIRVEVHGFQTQRLPMIARIFEIADHPAVKVCWNSNAQDLMGQGLAYNFDLVKGRFGATVHVRELNIGDYPYQDLIELFVDMDYDGWILLEARTTPADRVAALREQRVLFDEMVRRAQAKH